MPIPFAARAGLSLMRSSRSNASGADLFGGLMVAGEFDMSEFESEVRAMRDVRARKAKADALTWLSFNLQEESQKQIRSTFDRPTRWTQNATFVWRARASDRERMFAGVYFKDQALRGNPAGRYLHPNIAGRDRPHKGFEKALIRAGIMEPGEYASPGRNAPLDRHGNVAGSTIKQMLSQLKAGAADQWETAASRKRNKRGGLSGRRWFVADGSTGLARGIYYRTGRKAPVLVFHFHKGAPQYRIMYPFRQIMAKRAGMDSARVWRRAWKKHMIGPRRRKGK